ncbi:MAG: ATPase [Eubacteriaceae bacterium]|nr:ATPase [Eubacteriaceae bacterium]
MLKAYELLDNLQNEVENAGGVPFLSNKVILERDELLDIIEDIRSSLPEELKEAKRIIDEENRIKATAQRKASGLIEEAKVQKQQLIDTNTITKNAYEEADAIVRAAKQEASKLRARSIEYCSNLLGKAAEELKALLSTIDENRAELRDKRRIINRPEAPEYVE